MRLAKLNESRLVLTFDEFDDRWRHRLHTDVDREVWKAFCVALVDRRVSVLVKLRVLQHIAADRLGLDPALTLAYFNETVITMGYPSEVIGYRIPKRDVW